MPSKKKTDSKLKTDAEPAPESEVIQTDTGALAPSVEIVRPMITAEQARIAWKEYQELKKVFLDPNLDYQVIQIYQAGKGMVKKPFIKKSGWRKLATAFNISVEIIKEDRKEHTIRDTAGKEIPYFVVEVTAKAVAMNGRYMQATGSCASNERTFSKLEHDIRATAETRAKNRAISDLIGGGEVSAEELEQQVQAKQNQCSVDHSNLPDKVVAAGSKNTGRHYHKCTKCNFWEWIDGGTAETAEEAEKAEELSS
jgi:hypothetical protein